MKIYQYIGITMLAATMLTATSCSEYDDYNTASSEGTSTTSGATLWENIQQHPQLKDFASLVQAAGYDSELNATNFYTVWAPLDGTYDPAPFRSLDNKSLIRQFVQNHIANYGHQALGKLAEGNRIMMLNEKTYDFLGSTGNYTFDERPLVEANLANSNGVLHTMDGVANFYPNLYEFVTDSTINGSMELDSLRNFFLRYEETKLDEERSVPGPIVDGLQTYVDSVMETRNTLWNTLNVRMTNEDSTYTFIMPNNAAWRASYNKLKSSFNYLPTTLAQQFITTGISNTPLSITISNIYRQDSLVNYYLTRFLAYSNKNGYNKKLLDAVPSFTETDSLCTTTRQKFSNPEDIIGHTVKAVRMSNGMARIVDSLAMYPWETYCGEEIYRPTNSSNVARVATASLQNVSIPLANVNTEKVDISEMKENTYSYAEIISASTYSKAELDVYLSDVLSTTYDIYCVFVPENVDATKPDAKTLPNRVIFDLSYCDETGKLQNKVFLNEDEQNIADFKKRFYDDVPVARNKIADNATNHNTYRAFTNDTSKVDTVYVGEFTFPVCYKGLGKGYCPNLKIQSPFQPSQTVLTAAYSRDLRIAAVILKPKELVEFEEKNKK